MHARLQIPEPAASDVDSVVTALEMAALFGSKGEGNEVVRWLKRAAESAGAEGHDARALSLARTAAELDDQLRSSPDFGRTPSERVPAASAQEVASAPGAMNAGSSEAEALPIPLGRRSGFPKPPSRPASTTSSLSAPSSLTSRPPAPSQRAEPPPKPPLTQRSSTMVSAAARREATSQKPAAPRPSSLPAASRPSSLPAASRPSSLTPAPSSVRATMSAKPEVAKSEPVKTPSAPENPVPEPSAAALNGLGDDEPNTITDGPKAPEENGARASAGPEKPIKFAKGSVCSRQTARVSVQASTEPGVYVMRLLDDDETTLPGKAVEGLLVLVDPDAKLPTGDSN